MEYEDIELNICGINFKQYNYDDIYRYKDYNEFLRDNDYYGYVYIIVCSDKIKVGRSTQPNHRIKSQTYSLDRLYKLKINNEYECFDIKTIFISECFIKYPKLEAIIKQHLKDYSYYSSEVFNLDFNTFKNIVTNIDITEFNNDLNKIKNKILNKFNKIISSDLLTINDIKFIGIDIDEVGQINNIDIKWRNNWGNIYNNKNIR